MLTNLHVKNLALIEEADINFFDGLNIMTGETGAGKSIILGSVNIALGGKVTADIIRKGAEYALTELAFHIDDKKKIAALKDMDIEDAQDGDVIISRKIMPGRSQIKVNGMICTVSQVKSIASLLIDIHGQHDSQLLLKESSHLDMIDLYGGSTVSDVGKRYDVVYKQYREALSQLEQMDTDEESRQREISFIEFELHEIASADLKRGEDEELESRFRKMSNSQRIISDLSTAVQLLSEGSDNVMDMMGIAVKSVIEASSFDESLKSVADSCSCAEDMISDVCRQISDYVNDSSYDEEEYKEVEERLDMINSFKLKYGRTIDDILEYADKRQEKLDALYHYDASLAQLKETVHEKEEELQKLADELTAARKKAASGFCKKVSEGLSELNFLNHEFNAEFEQTGHFTSNGGDSVKFMISTNVGEPLKPLSKVASGGELSRIMLAIKTVMAGKDDTQTLIFDEIDAGISGRTAQLVGEKLKQLSCGHQIICITHLPQIASMADTHFVIEKTASGDVTTTDIRQLSDENSIDELARLLGGSAITDAVRNNAAEMKNMAKAFLKK